MVVAIVALGENEDKKKTLEALKKLKKNIKCSKQRKFSLKKVKVTPRIG